MMASKFTLVFLFVMLLLWTASAGKGKRRRGRRCKYDKRGAAWSQCDLTLQVKTKVASLARGRSSCPKTRIFTKPCDDGSIRLNGCEYIQVSDWSDCDPATLTSTRTLELRSGDTKMCDNNRVESKECGKDGEEDEDTSGDEKDNRDQKKKKRRRGKGMKRKRQRKKKRRRKKKKMESEMQSECQYEAGDWSDCDLRTGLQTLVKVLKASQNESSTEKCEQTVVSTRKCITVPEEEMMENMSDDKNRRRKKKKKNRDERKKQRRKKKKKGKQDKKLKRNKKKKDKEELSKEPPRLTELHVVPYTTFAVVSWQPPQHDGFGQHIPVDKYQIGYGQGFPDLHTVQVNGTEVTYKIENLEPGRQYIVSIRAENRMGVGQALYETIMTRDAGGASNTALLPPIGVRATVLSSEAVNVSWVDMTGKDDPASRKREYHLRYRQLNNQDRIKMLKTSDTFLVVNGLQPFTNYEFAVRTSDGERNSTWSMMVWNMTQEAAPSTSPEDLTVILDPDSPGQVLLSWQPPSKANGIITSYEVSHSTYTMEGQPLVKTMNVEGNKLSVVLTSLVPGLTYDFAIKAKNSKGVGPPLTINNYLLPGDPAPVPATLRASPTVNDPTAVTLSWEISEKVTTNILGFVILYTSDLDSEHVHWEVESRIGKDLKTAVIENLKPGTKYYFKIQAHTSLGYGPESNTVLFHTPSEDEPSPSPIEAPEKLHVNVLSSTSAILSWQDPGLAKSFKEDVVLPASSYTVRYRTLDPEPSEYTLISPPFTSLYLVDLLPLTRYEFSVKVQRGNQQSEWSVPVENATFAADFSQYPLKAEVKGQKQSPQVAILSWQPHSDSKIKEYVVMYSSDRRKPHKQWIQKAAVNQDIKQQVFYNLKPETTYFFFVQAMTDLGFGPRSKVVSYTTPKEDKASPHLKQPDNLQVIVMSANSAVVSWHDPDLAKNNKDKDSDKPSQPRTYTLRYRDLGEKSLGYSFATPTFPSIFMVDLRPATKFEFSVRVDMGDHHSEWSSPVVNTTFEAAPSSAPLNVSVTIDGGDPTTALLTWKPPEFPNGEITGYLVFYETKKESESITVPGGELIHHVPFLKPQTNYFFRVGAKNSKGFSPLSSRVAYRTPRVIGSPPTDASVIPSPDDPYNAIVNWQPPKPSKRRIKYYTITHYTEELKHRKVQKVPGDTLTAVVKKLLPSTTYHFTLQAHYRRGGGPHSDVVKYSIPKEIL